MAESAAGVSVSIDERRIIGKQKRNRLRVTLPAVSDVVELPAFAAFGLTRAMEFLNVLDEAAGFWRYDRETNKLLAVRPGAPSAFSAEAVGW